MTSACVSKNTLMDDTQVFLKFRDSTFEICLHLINSNFTSYFLSSSMLSGGAGTSKHLTPGDACLLTFVYSMTSSGNFLKSSSLYYFSSSLSLTIAMNPLVSLDSSSIESDVFYVERSSEESSPIKNNTPASFSSTELSGAMGRGTITISSVASPEPRTVTIDSDSNEPTTPYGFGSQHPIVPPSLNDLNLPPDSFNVLATVAVIRVNGEYSPQSPEPSIPSTISTPTMIVSTNDGWETTHTTDDATFILTTSPEESIGVFLQATPLTPMSQETYVLLRALPPHRCLHEDKKEN